MNRAKVVAIAKEIAIWLPTLLLAFVFVVQGLAKFSATSGWVDRFRDWGYPDWFRMLIGVAELLAGSLLLLPRTASVGAAIIMVVMVGGMSTHALIDHRPRDAFREVIPFVLASIVLLARRKRLMEYLRRQR